MALEAGKHVVCTKPLMVDLTMAKELLEAQRRSGKQVFIGQSSRYFEAAMHQRRDFEKGRNGELVTVETHYNSDSRWFLERAWSHREGFSWMYNFLIHAVDLALWYLPEVEDAYGVGVCSANSASRGVMAPDSLKFLLKDKRGVCASVNGNYAVPGFGKQAEHFISCTLRGTSGSSKAECPFDYYHHSPSREFSIPRFMKITTSADLIITGLKGTAIMPGNTRTIWITLPAASGTAKRPSPICRRAFAPCCHGGHASFTVLRARGEGFHCAGGLEAEGGDSGMKYDQAVETGKTACK